MGCARAAANQQWMGSIVAICKDGWEWFGNMSSWQCTLVLANAALAGWQVPEESRRFLASLYHNQHVRLAPRSLLAMGEIHVT